MSWAGVSQAAPDHANVIHHRRKIVLVLWVKLCSVDGIPIHATRGAFMRRLEGGERERHLRAMGDATSSPGRTRAASSGTMDPARSDHGQRHKGQDAALARRKAWRCIAMHLIVRSNPDTRPE